jgi:GNAT superfamily N-acetyltransferase
VHPDYTIRLASPDDIPRLARIEREAAAQFRDLGITGAFLDESASSEDLLDAQRDGRLWVAVRGAEVAGFAIAHVQGDSEAWLHEVDVHPDHGRRGVGRALVHTVIDWARGRGCSWIGLTTFRDVPWNEPFYASVGFRELPPDQCSAAILEILEDEASRGLPADKRLAMRMDL